MPFSVRGYTQPDDAGPIRGPASSAPRRLLARNPTALVFASRREDDAGGVNGVVTVGLAALLLLGRGYAERAPRARPASRFRASRGASAESSPALLVASCASMTTRGSLPRNQKTAGVSHLPSFDD